MAAVTLIFCFTQCDLRHFTPDPMVAKNAADALRVFGSGFVFMVLVWS